jgi:hypothetical protein
MVNQYVSPADKLARQVVKFAAKDTLDKPLTLALVATWIEGETPSAIDAAIDHATREGWLVVSHDGWMLTAAGEEIGRRSRAGIRNKRRQGWA